jgi:TIR domain
MADGASISFIFIGAIALVLILGIFFGKFLSNLFGGVNQKFLSNIFGDANQQPHITASNKKASDPLSAESNRLADAEPLPQARQGVKTPTVIFISYRRQDSGDVTGRIYDRLVQQFGREAIFKDVDSIPLGVDFRGVLDKAVGQCNLLLAVIGRQWLSSQNESGARRLDDARDFVRIEIEAALQRNIPVIPLLVQGAMTPGENDLPPSLQALVYRNAIPIRPDPDFHPDVDRLIKGIELHFKNNL